MHGIRIRKEQPIALCLLGAEPNGMVFSDPACWQARCFQQAHLGKLRDESTHDFGGAIGGLIVDHKNLCDFGLLSQRFDAGGDDRFFVARRNDG